tara:strand:+ start:554 stop:802 length:249 start_codon:yes stop_codon:yes gene_type:complete
MEKLEQARLEMCDVLSGAMKANDACEMVQSWIQLTCYDLAHSVATRTTKKGRADALTTIQTDSPEFYDDVKEIAKEIFKNGK